MSKKTGTGRKVLKPKILNRLGEIKAEKVSLGKQRREEKQL